MAKNRRNRKKQRKHTNWGGRTPAQDRLDEHQLQQTQTTNLVARVRRLAERATEFLGPAGAVIEHHDGQLLINGTTVTPDGSGALAMIDEAGLQHYGQRLQDLADREIVQRIPDITVQMRSHLLELQRDGKRVASIKPTHASIEAEHGPRIDGNFLLAGHACWEELRAGLGAETPTTVLTELPEYASARDQERAITATTRIRHDRTRDFAARVRIRREIDGVMIAFQKISTSQQIEVPFELTNPDGSMLRAALRLTGSGQILPLSIADPPADNTVLVRAWLIALETFAHLTCANPDTARLAENDGRAGRGPQQHTGAAAGQTDLGQVRPLRPVQPPRSASPSELPGDLVPTAVTAHALAQHHVVGHPRQLPPGNTPDPDKVRSAAARGIKLAPGVTWVKSHWRGTGDDPELEFRWHIDASAADLNQHAA
jgi:hypothetical protein